MDIKLNPIELSLFSNRISAVCEEMGAVLQRAAFSPNIRDRLDFSCAVFDAQGGLCAQAAHIPVHLGSMAFAMRDIIQQIDWQSGDMVVVNDPYLGGTHLPDVTVIAPVFVTEQLQGFVANRAHHADIGGQTPGSMPISRSLEEEGIILPPQKLVMAGQLNETLMEAILVQTRHRQSSQGDFTAQISANRTGVARLAELIERHGATAYQQLLVALNDYAQRLAQGVITTIPDGEYSFTDDMDDDGLGNRDLPIALTLTIHDDQVIADFTGTAAQTTGNINCPVSVVAAAVYYVFRCLMPDQTPACDGSFRAIQLQVPAGSLLNAQRPAAVAAGNVETSTRIVDVVMGALAKAIPTQIPAASHGSMNNLAMGGIWQGQHWDYYETIGGGMGAGPRSPGLSGVQTHMTNTRNTPVEVLERHYPLRVTRYALRRGSGGAGQQPGGDGLIREFEFLDEASVTLLTERRTSRPWGLAGGESALAGVNKLNDEMLPPKVTCQVKAGDRLTIETPGGGGWGMVREQ